MSKFNFDKITISCDWCSKKVDKISAIYESMDKRKHICFACTNFFGPDLVEDCIPRPVGSVVGEKYVENLWTRLSEQHLTPIEEQKPADEWVASDGSWSEC